jgi:2-dehydro-3-deoxygluconokinase
MKTIVTFGEVMARLGAPGYLRLRQSRSLDVTYAGGEVNVAASLALFGAQARFVTALPENLLGDACRDFLRAVGIDTSHVLMTDYGRLGLYFVETGANQRPSNVIYDREYSAIALTPPDRYDWDAIFADAGWLHITGITPAISQSATDSSLEAVRRAKAAGLEVSCDLNFRKKLWKWDPAREPRALAEATMRQILPHVDLVIANEEDCSEVLGIQAEDTDVDAGSLEIDRYPDVARKVVRDFPNVRKVAITLRESLSASHNNWGAMLYLAEDDQPFFAPLKDGAYDPYEIKNIVDRVGGGDSFAGGLIFALNTPEYSDPRLALQYAAAASCLAHSIKGDFNYSQRAEVDALMGGSASGRVVR